MSRHSNILAIENSLLVVVDVQAKLVSTLLEDDAAQMIKNGVKLLKATKTLGVPVAVTEQYPKGLGHTAPQLINQLPDNTPVYDKTGFSCCTADGFFESLKNSGRKQIILIGMETHVCVLQTTFELLEKGYQVYIVEDTTCSRNTDHKFYALQRMQQHGATVTCYESVLFEWLKNSNHPDFKTISQLIR